MRFVLKAFKFLGLISAYLVLISITDQHNYILPIIIVIIYLYSLYNSFRQVLIFTLPLSILFIISIVTFPETTSKGSAYIVCIFLLIFGLKMVKNKLLSHTFILFLIPISIFIILPNSIHLYANRKSHTNLEYKFENLKTRDGKTIFFKDNEIVILDLWTSSCAICFKKFPKFEELKNKYSSNPNIKFYSVNVRLPKENKLDVYKIVERLDYDFQTIYTEYNPKFQDKINWNTYPLLIIFRNGKIKFRGSFATENNLLFHRLDQELKRIM